MTLFLITFLIFLVLIAAMAIGVMFGRRPVQGSCGGIAALDGLPGGCEICGWSGEPGTAPGKKCPDTGQAN